MSIIKSNSIWFSDVRYMNDKSESIFVVKRLLEFAEKREKDFPVFHKALKKLLQYNDCESIKNLTKYNVRYFELEEVPFLKHRNFIFCTSTEADSLQMWNYYASDGKYSGYNIGLSVQKLRETFDTDSEGIRNAFEVIYGKVLYSEEDQFAYIEEFAKRIQRGNPDEEKLSSIDYGVIWIRHFIECDGLFFKDSKFSSENEYRFMISISDKRIPRGKGDGEKYSGKFNKLIYEDFRIRNGVIVPYLIVTIPPQTIGCITTPPMIEYEIAEASIKELLDIKQVKDIEGCEVEIRKSRIPIRF